MTLSLQKWIELERLSTNAAADRLGISHSHVYKYTTGQSIPKPVIMQEIFWGTRGIVTANDFYGTTEEAFRKRLEKELEKILKQEGEIR